MERSAIIKIGIGEWRASVTTNDIASSKKRGGHPMGGGLSLLWHKNTGPISVASMNDYVRYEGSNMQSVKTKDEKFCLTPRIEVIKDSTIYSNLYDAKATMTWVKKGDSIHVKIKGELTSVSENVLRNSEGAFEIIYLFTPTSFSMAVHSTAVDAKLIFPILYSSSEKITGGVDTEIFIQKRDSFIIKLSSSPTTIWSGVDDNRVFNFVPGFEAVPLKVSLDKSGNGLVRIEVVNP